MGERQSGRKNLQLDVAIVTDVAADADHLTATLRVLLGYNAQIRICSIGALLDGLAEHRPSHVFIAEMAGPSIDAVTATTELRGAGYDGLLIVVCSHGSQGSRARLITSGASDVIHKDDLCSARVAEAFGRATKPGKK